MKPTNYCEAFCDATGTRQTRAIAAASATAAPCASTAAPPSVLGEPGRQGRAVETVIRRRAGAPGYFSGSCELEPTSLADWLLAEVRKRAGRHTLPPEAFTEQNELSIQIKACRQCLRDICSQPDPARHRGHKDDGPAPASLYPAPPEWFERAIFRDPLGGGGNLSAQRPDRAHRRLMVLR